MTAEPRRLRLGALVLLLAPCEPPRLWRVCGVEGEDDQACAFGEKALAGRVLTQDELKRALAEGWPLTRLAAKGRAL